MSATPAPTTPAPTTAASTAAVPASVVPARAVPATTLTTESAALRPALWRQLVLVAQVVQQVHAGRSATAAIDAVPSNLRGGVQALAFATLRNWGRASTLRAAMVGKKPEPAVDALLCVALALLAQPVCPYEPFTLVNQAVEAAKHTPAARRQAAFINACLRRFLRERMALMQQTDANPLAQWNYPLWWVQHLQADHPQHWQDILQAGNVHAPMTLRVNPRQSSVAAYLAQLQAVGLSGHAVDSYAIALEHAVPVTQLPGFAQGVVSVQDAAAQLAAPLLLEGLAVSEHTRILDACAAPGGKTAHLLELCPAQVVALDVDATRCQRIEENLARLQLRATVLVADAAQPAQWWDGIPFDAILLDAPCTASGIVRRHPDVRWLRRLSDIAQLAALQATILIALWPTLRVGGRLLYCTCSVFRQEGQAQVQSFLANNTNAELLPSPGHLLPTNSANLNPVLDNQRTDYDGFFYALLEKKAP